MHSKNQKHHGSPGPSRSPVFPMKPKTSAVAPAVNPSPGDTLGFRVPKDYPHSRFNKAPLAVYPPKGSRSKSCVSLPVVSLEKMPCLNRTNSASHVRLNSSAPPVHKSSSLPPPSSGRSSEKLLNGRSTGAPQTPRSSSSQSSKDGRPSPARSPLDRRLTSSASPSSQLDRKPSPSPSQRCSALISSSPAPDKKQQNGTKTSAVRPYRRLSGRVFDPNKHCGVPDPETKRSCTRSLTCKSHSLTQRRAVPGRRKHFDILLAEHKGRAKEKEKEKEEAKEREKERDVAHERKELNQSALSHEASPSKPHCPNGRPLSTLKLRLANAHIPRAPGPVSSSSTPVPPAPTPPPLSNPEPTPDWTSSARDGGRLSSDEGETETAEEIARAPIHFSSRHPQPLGLCIFSSRLMGRGHYVFDRRWDRMRLALQNMVEKHLNSQMWRKVPLAAESLQCPSGSSSVSSQQPHPPSPLSGSSPVSSTNCYTATFPQTTGVFSIRDAPLSHTAPGKAANGTNRLSRPTRVTEDSSGSSKKRKNSTFFSFSPTFPAMDNHKTNGNSHPMLQGGGGTVASPVRRKELGGGGGGLWGSPDSWMSRAGGNHNSHHSRNSGVTAPFSSTKDAVTAPYLPLPSPSVPLSHGGKPESLKRRSPSSHRGKGSKVSRPGELGGSFGKGNDSAGILASGSESPRQVKMHH